MFGFSITKLLFTIAAVIVVWNGFKWYNRMQENRAASAGGKPARGNQGSAAKSAAGPEADGAFDSEEMIKCVACETYVSSANAVSCGKDGCPYPG
jgi:hypothetical protein